VIITCNREHQISSALRVFNGSSTHSCTPEAARTQGRFSFDDLNDLVSDLQGDRDYNSSEENSIPPASDLDQP